jgi:hypothetical protein
MSSIPRDDHGATLLYTDLRMRSMVAGEMRRRGLTKVFGVAGTEQSLLVTLALLAALGAVAGEYISRLPRPPGLPSRSDGAIGGAMLNAGLRGIAGPPAAKAPLAGVVIGGAMLVAGARPAAAAANQVVHEARMLEHRARTAFFARYRGR